jgi:NAD(P)-dependent dehydrogenase (short-subunit alcohol dehydrogenase family)
MKRLTDRVTIVTGSSSGIGKAIACVFGREGARVVVAARRQNLCEQTVAQIHADGGQAISIPTDVTDESQVDRLIADTVRRFGRLDILVNNAGIGGGGRIIDTSTETFDRVIATNLRGTFLCARAGLGQMMRNGGGVILNMSSVAGVQAWAGTGAYSASKHGIMALTKAMADEGRPHKIKVCAICPGGVADELVDAPPIEIERSGAISPFDVAETCVYLATLGPNTIVQQIVLDRMMADW